MDPNKVSRDETMTKAVEDAAKQQGKRPAASHLTQAEVDVLTPKPGPAASGVKKY